MSVSLSICRKMTLVNTFGNSWLDFSFTIVSYLNYFFLSIKSNETDIPIAETVIGSYYMNMMNYKNFPAQQDTY